MALYVLKEPCSLWGVTDTWRKPRKMEQDSTRTVDLHGVTRIFFSPFPPWNFHPHDNPMGSVLFNRHHDQSHTNTTLHQTCPVWLTHQSRQYIEIHLPFLDLPFQYPRRATQNGKSDIRLLLLSIIPNMFDLSLFTRTFLR